jgi:hypothetical protein
MASSNASDYNEDAPCRRREEEFEKLCLALRRNDPAVTNVDRIVAESFGARLGDALRGNTHVSSLVLCAENGYIVSKKLDINPVHVMSLLDFVRQSQSLRKVDFSLGRQPDYLPYLLEAVLENPLITDLSFCTDDEYEVPLEIGPLIESKLNLKVLGLRVLPGDVFHEALKANQTIETLSMNFRLGTLRESDLILRSISNHPRLTRLALWSDEDQKIDGDALSTLLASTTLLECLEMEFPIDSNFMERFVNGLQANRSITELQIPIYFLHDQEIASLFVSYMQTRNGMGASCIRTLRVSGYFRWGEDDNTYFWRALALLLTGPRGCGLETAVLDELDHGELWAGLEANEQSRNLRCMNIDWDCNYGDDCNREFATMLRHLPKMLYLRKLQFHSLPDDHDRSTLWKFMRAVRNNGSLHFVEYTIDIDEDFYTDNGSYFDGTVYSAGRLNGLLHAWGQRNLELPTLMRPHDEDDDVVARKVARKCQDNTSPSRSRRVTNNAHLLPSLLLVARQTPRMAPNLKFSGLVAQCFVDKCSFPLFAWDTSDWPLLKYRYNGWVNKLPVS